jgi:hypothetical protein
MKFDELVLHVLAEKYDPEDEFDVLYRVNRDTGKLMYKNVKHINISAEQRKGWQYDREKALNAAGIYRSKYDDKKFIRRDRVTGKYVEVFPFGNNPNG